MGDLALGSDLKENKKLFWTLYISINLIIFLYFYYFNFRFPLHDEDWIGSEYLVYHKLDFFKIKAIFHDVVNYFHWNARIGQSLSSIFSYFDKYVYNIFISLITTIFINLVFFYSFSRNLNKYRDIFLLLIIFVLLISIPSSLMFADMFLFKSRALNHLFGNVILLLVFIPYFYLFYNKDIIQNKLNIFLLVPVVYFISFINSYMSVPLFLGMMCLSILVYYIKNKKIPIWSIIGVIFSVCGYLFVLKTSEEIARRGVLDTSRLFKTFYKVPSRFQEMNNLFGLNSNLFIIFLIVFGIFAIALFYKKKFSLLNNEFFIKILLLLGLYIGYIIIFSSGANTEVGGHPLFLFFVLCFWIININIFFDMISKLKNSIARKSFYLITFFLLLFLLLYNTQAKFKFTLDVSKATKSITNKIRETQGVSPKEGYELVIQIPKNVVEYGYRCFFIQYWGGNTWCTRGVIRYYGGYPNLKFEMANDNSTEYRIIERKVEGTNN
ncbi:MAG: DUF6056 family protein [Alphaproteobacteria bacterium]|nr:DUF6056 family protein [Alphaproteobacteria bacterium]